MKKTLLTTIAVIALAGSAVAQSPQEHQQHHPGGAASTQAAPAQPLTPSTPGAQPQTQMPMGQMMQGRSGTMHGSPAQGPAGGQAGMMMNCPMMQGGMAGMMMGGRGMAGMAGMAGPTAQQGDQSVPSLVFRAVNDKMHRDMAIEFTGKVDADFANAMIAHHQGAVDMAKVELAFGKDPEMRKLAEEVVRTQEPEISAMREWLVKQPK